MSFFNEEQKRKASAWSQINRNKEEKDIRIFWSNLFIEEKEELIHLSGYSRNFASYGFDALTPELKEMLKFAIREN